MTKDQGRKAAGGDAVDVGALRRKYLRPGEGLDPLPARDVRLVRTGDGPRAKSIVIDVATGEVIGRQG